MSINSVTNNPSIGLPTNDLGAKAPAFKSMSPAQIISFVQDTYANIDGQLADYQEEATAKNLLANQLRDYKKLVREYQGKDAADFPEGDNELRTEVARREAEFKAFEGCTDPELKQAIAELKAQVLPRGDLPQPVDQDWTKYSGSDEDGKRAALSQANAAYQHQWEAYRPPNLTKERGDELLKNADDTLQTLNQDNELTMMRLSTLMQQRQHVTSAATNQMESHNQCINGILQNMR